MNKKAKENTASPKDLPVPFPLKRAVFRILLSFAFAAVMFGNIRILAGLCAASAFTAGLFFGKSRNLPQKALFCFLISLLLSAVSIGLLFLFRDYTLRAWLCPWLFSILFFLANEWLGKRLSLRNATLFRFLSASAVLFSCFLG